jgi:hypothetical protein
MVAITSAIVVPAMVIVMAGNFGKFVLRFKLFLEGCL